MAEREWRGFDADNHYYEALDAFTRHIEPEYAKRAMQWAQVDGKTRLLVGGKVNRFIPDPTFSKLARPGVLEEYFRGNAGGSVVTLFGELEPTRREYRERDERLKAMDELRLDGALFFPTLGVGMEQSLRHDLPAMTAAFRAFNAWLDEDWGFHYKERIFGAPYLTLADVGNAVAQLDWVLERGARVVVMQAGPIWTERGWKNPGDPLFDPFWARVNEAGIVVAYHGGDTVYSDITAWWGESGEVEAFRGTPLRGLLSPSPIADTLASMLAYRMFSRFPHLRVAAIETGSDWLGPLFKLLKKSFVQNPQMWDADPRETFRRHVWISPFHENDLSELKEQVGAERIMLGSDWPHVEGLAEPLAFVKDLEQSGYSDDEIQLVVHDNAAALVRPQA
ncbi:amidohydrolase [Actinomadura craniellae]|uniref:Amidohydrolase n=1 Tax=Actinomadura craniellae TaxID=2231787 RepID=A0A365H037_9ACTN|nr:amidohydrolase family protein [Actinomadura craniellae]RAY12406.1 amidohydrolase [Actinomadura craniellae]